eukprot:6380116-Amphidinium_carterae.1
MCTHGALHGVGDVRPLHTKCAVAWSTSANCGLGVLKSPLTLRRRAQVLYAYLVLAKIAKRKGWLGKLNE